MSNARNLANLLGTGTTIASAKIADDAITNAKILNDAVTGAKIEDNPTIAGNESHIYSGCCERNSER